MDEPIIIGVCPICDRDMWEGPYIDKHHMVPKEKGGRYTEYLHKVCHRKIHSVFSNKELEKEYNTPEKIIAHPEIAKFIIFVKKKSPDYYDRNVQHKRKKKKR